MPTSAPRNPFQLIVPSATVRYLSGVLALLLALLPLRVAATSVVPPQFEELVNESDCVVRAVVKSVRSERLEKDGKSRIYTFVEVEVREAIVGTPAQPLVLRMLGGQVDNEVLVVKGAPKFEVGQEDILFIRGNGRQFTPLTAMMHGRYPVLKEAATGRAYVARANRAPLTSVSEVAQPMTEARLAPAGVQSAAATAPALSQDAFVQQIRNAVNPNYRSARAK